MFCVIKFFRVKNDPLSIVNKRKWTQTDIRSQLMLQKNLNEKKILQ